MTNSRHRVAGGPIAEAVRAVVGEEALLSTEDTDLADVSNGLYWLRFHDGAEDVTGDPRRALIASQVTVMDGDDKLLSVDEFAPGLWVRDEPPHGLLNFPSWEDAFAASGVTPQFVRATDRWLRGCGADELEQILAHVIEQLYVWADAIAAGTVPQRLRESVQVIAELGQPYSIVLSSYPVIELTARGRGHVDLVGYLGGHFTRQSAEEVRAVFDHLIQRS
ncbi:hypothetical protein [Nocardia puris]|uniref:Uncharacterized protein n=2 Tax=Nocardia puris TaxID=208602 RepID=A0A366DMM7_9NOCA|nr:hypothetical protein [Nocardia puris]RBO91321.1 hypothetical protein DFR74_10423 [Nocardia puris]